MCGLGLDHVQLRHVRISDGFLCFRLLSNVFTYRCDTDADADDRWQMAGGRWQVADGRWQDAGCWMQDAGCRTQDAGCRM